MGRVENFVSKLPNHVKLVADLISDTFLTAKADLDRPRHRCVEGCETHANCFGTGTEELVEPYARQIINEKLDIFDTEEVVDCYKMMI